MSEPSRRDLLKLASLTLAVGSLGCGDDGAELFPDGGGADGASPDGSTECPLTGAQTAGPYYPGEPETRMNILGDRTGVALELVLTVLEAGSCEPLVGAEVDVWTADSNGDYSGYAVFGTEGEDWLRGQQITSDAGAVVVDGIVPGAYPGRAVHVHIKVRAQGHPELTTQLYFPDAMVADVLLQPGYQGATQTTNSADGFYADDTLMDVQGSTVAGYTATATVYA